MAGDRYVLLGLARPRAAWFHDVARWATSASIPAEFVKCVSAEELRARLGGGRVWSAVLLDGALPAVDRDLLASVREAGSAAVVIDDDGSRRDWLSLGASAVLASALTRERLLEALDATAQMVGRAAAVGLADAPGSDETGPVTPALVVAVCGPGGTGASTVAAAVAQGLALDPDVDGPVVLADLALHAEQAMLHDVRDVVPGVQELVELHRSRHPSGDEVRALTFLVVERHYRLLLGLRRARYWSAVRRRSFEAAFASLRTAFGAVVCDVTADFEGEGDAGSVDVEDRNLMARTAVRAADAVLVVGRPGAKGTHALVRVLVELAAAGVPAGRVVPVVNVAPRHPRARAELTAAIAALATPAMGGGHPPSPVFLPARRVEEAIRDAVPLPAPLPATLAGAVRATVGRVGRADAGDVVGPEPVVPGSLGHWSD